MKDTFCEPTTVWRLRRGANVAHAVIVPAWHHATLIWWLGSRIQGAEDFPTLNEAITAGERVRSLLLAAGWIETS